MTIRDRGARVPVPRHHLSDVASSQSTPVASDPRTSTLDRIRRRRESVPRTASNAAPAGLYRSRRRAREARARPEPITRSERRPGRDSDMSSITIKRIAADRRWPSQASCSRCRSARRPRARATTSRRPADRGHRRRRACDRHLGRARGQRRPAHAGHHLLLPVRAHRRLRLADATSRRPARRRLAPRRSRWARPSTGFLARLPLPPRGHQRRRRPRQRSRPHLHDQARRSQFDAPKTVRSRPPLGGTFVLSGTLTGHGQRQPRDRAAGHPYPYTDAFINVGAPRRSRAPPAVLLPRAGPARAARSSASSRRHRARATAVVTEQVTVRVILKVRSTGRKGLVRLYGTVTPAEVGRARLLPAGKDGQDGQAGKPEKPEKPGSGAEKSEQAPRSRPSSTRRQARHATHLALQRVVSVATRATTARSCRSKPGALVSGTSPTVLLARRAHQARARKRQKKG